MTKATALTSKTITLSEKVRGIIDETLKKFPADQKQSALLPALTAAQADNQGYLTDDLIKAVATYLAIPEIAAFEAATFYSMYNLKPVGKHEINVCTNISCMLRGAEKIVGHLENKLNIKIGETTQDGQFTLRHVECLGACIGAPMCMIGDTYHENLTPEKMDGILNELHKQKS